MNITLRTATEEDADFLFQLQRATMQAYVVQTWGEWDDAWQRRRFRQHFNSVACQIVLDQNQAIGVICVERDANEIRLGKIELLPAYQGRRIGTELLMALVTEANQQRVPLTLQVLKVNPARRLYERLGFVICSETATHWLMTTQIVHTTGENDDALHD
jgi:ribosomal protein S18 acetylase RimI-like enzyme